MFQIREVHDIASVDMAAGLVGVLALAGGICDGISLGGNTKAAIIRMGLIEIARFIETFFPTARRETLFESCGVADLLALSMAKSGRHRKCAEEFARFMARSHRMSDKPNGTQVTNWELFAADVWEDVTSAEHGFIAGVATLKDIWPLVLKSGIEKDVPLIGALYRVVIKGDPPTSLIHLR